MTLRARSGSRDDSNAPTTYYDRPALKEPVWIWAVPAYFYVGGAAGAAATLGAAAQLVDRDGLRGLVSRCRWIAALGIAGGTALLIYDLGRPERFFNMLRVFRPTSPLNVGSWVLAGAGPTAGLAAVASSRRCSVGAVGDAAGLVAGALGLPLAGYTAVLLTNTAVPVWQAAGTSLPGLFVASAGTAAASLLELAGGEVEEQRVVRVFGIVAKSAELVATVAVERQTASIDEVAAALRGGVPRVLLQASKGLTAASLLLTLLARDSRAARVAAGALGTAAAVAVKFGIFRAGKASALDPRATFAQQRAGGGGAEATGKRATTHA